MSSFIEAIASDADGTLVDSVQLIRHGQYETAITYLRNHGIPEKSIPDFPRYVDLLNQIVGGSARQTLERTVKLLYEKEQHHIESADYDELNLMLDPIQDELAPKYVKAFPGLSDTLHYIGKTGLKLAIFTSGTPHHVVRNFGIALADEMGEGARLYKDTSLNDSVKLDIFCNLIKQVYDLERFTVVTCDDVGEQTKPNPLGVQLSMMRLGVKPENTLLIGDHAYDIEAGMNAGIALRVGITHGFDGEAKLLQAGATNVINSLSELPVLIKSINRS